MSRIPDLGGNAEEGGDIETGTEDGEFGYVEVGAVREGVLCCFEGL